MADRLPEHILKEIKDSMKAAGLSNASFDSVVNSLVEKVTVTYKSGHESVFNGTVTDFIRDKVRLHHESWIIAPLQEILNWSASTDDGSMNEYDILGRLRSKMPNPAVMEEARAEIVRLRDEVATLTQFKNVTKQMLKALEEC